MKSRLAKHTSQRGKTAIRRGRCSRPVALALENGLIHTGVTFFDYGCGHGEDLLFLESTGIEANGWDPAHRPDTSPQSATVVNLGYVLNVIDDARERDEVLRRAFELAEELLIVSVRVDRSLDGLAEQHADGLVTRKGTFQKIYTQGEFREYISDTLQVQSYPAALGVAYVFKSPELESQFLARQTLRRSTRVPATLAEEFRENPLARAYVERAQELGRAPVPTEFGDYKALIDRYGPKARLLRLLSEAVDDEAFGFSREQRKQDILTYLAELLLRQLKAPKLTALEPAIQQDVRTLWKSYTAAKQEATAFLYSMGQENQVKAAIQSCPFGKLLPEDFYIHESLEPELPPLLRLILFAARQIVGDTVHDVTKINLDGRAVSFLKYENFDEVAHPRLLYSTRVYLPKAAYSIREYADSENPPILHRKELLVSEIYPHYERFCALTEAEEDAGLLAEQGIGFQKGWNVALETRGIRIDGHELTK